MCEFVQSQTIPLFSLINSFYHESFSCFHYQNTGKRSKLQRQPPPQYPTTIAFLFQVICATYFTSLWINAVLNHWIWDSVQRTTNAEQQLGRFCLVQSMRSFLSNVMGSEKHAKVHPGTSAVSQFLYRILHKNRCWPSSCLCLQNRLLSNNVSRLKI